MPEDLGQSLRQQRAQIHVHQFDPLCPVVRRNRSAASRLSCSGATSKKYHPKSHMTIPENYQHENAPLLTLETSLDQLDVCGTYSTIVCKPKVHLRSQTSQCGTGGHSVLDVRERISIQRIQGHNVLGGYSLTPIPSKTRGKPPRVCR